MYEMPTEDMKWPMYQMVVSGYELTENDFGTQWLGYEMTGNR